MRPLLFAILPCFALLPGAGVAQASVMISAEATKHMRCSAGVCSPTAKKAVLNVNDLTSMLASGDVEVVTGNGAVTITIAAPFSWTSTSRLTLDATESVGFRAPVTVAGTGAVTITTNDGGSGGDLLFFPGAKLDFWDLSSNLSVNGTQYVLVSTLADLAAAIHRNNQCNCALITDFDASSDHLSWPIDNFSGTFEGLGHQIENLSGSNHAFHHPAKRVFPDIGLFSTAYGTVRDIALTRVAFNFAFSRRGRYGAIAAQSYGTIDNVSADVSVTVTGRRCYQLGGLVGLNEGTVKSSYTSGSIHGCEWTGGIAGANGGSIYRSHSSAVVSTGGLGEEGGLVGSNLGLISQSYATGTVSGLDAGGLAGTNYYGTIDQSFAAGSVLGRAEAGGLVGYNAAAISNSYATGFASGRNAAIGGLGGIDTDNPNCVPTCMGTITTSYSTTAVGRGALRGGAIGQDKTAAHGNSSVYWDFELSDIKNPSKGAGNIKNDPGITGLTDAQLKSGLPAGFDSAIWGQSPSINNGYPYLLANPPPQ